MDLNEVKTIGDCREIKQYNGYWQEQNVIVIDTETINGKPYTIQFYDGLDATIEYVNEKTVFDVYCDYIAKRAKPQTSVWYFYCQFDLPIIHYPFKEYFTADSHTLGYGDFDFSYITGKTWFGNHKYKNVEWVERDAFQYCFRGLEKVAKDLKLSLTKEIPPDWLGKRGWKNDSEKKVFESYAIRDVLVLWELVYWILSIHRKYNVGLSVSLADLCGKIFRRKFCSNIIVPTRKEVTMAALCSYHGGKTEMYAPGPCIVKDVYEYDITSAYPYAMTQIGNFFDYEIQHTKDVDPNGIYKVTGDMLCNYQPLYTHEFERTKSLSNTWVTGWELVSCLKRNCFKGKVHEGYRMESYNKTENGLAEYVWHFFKKKQEADQEKNITERLWSKLALNSLYGKFISRIAEESDYGNHWRGGILFHPFIATLITGFVRGYVHDIEHACKSLHTSTDAFITKMHDLESMFPGVNGLGALKKEYHGDALIVRPKVYVIFDKIDASCFHRFTITEGVISCKYCKGKVLKAATHAFFGSVQLLLNMWGRGQKNYMVHRMIRLKEAKRSKDPDLLPFVFTDQRRSLNVDWNKLQIFHKGELHHA